MELGGYRGVDIYEYTYSHTKNRDRDRIENHGDIKKRYRVNKQIEPNV